MKSVIEDIYEVRKDKLLKMLKDIDPLTPVKFLSTCGSAEINALRPAFTASYTVVNQMQDVID